MTKPEFKKFSQFERGVMFDLLKDSYSFEKGYERDWIEDWREADNFFYDHLEIADECGFITVLDGAPIGFISWDPRKMPECAELGHNCIAAAYKGKGYGRAQLREAVCRIRSQNVCKIIVTTDERLIPAQRNYQSAGFQLKGYRENCKNPQYAGRLMDYELIL